MTQDEYLRVRASVETMLATLRDLYPWCKVRITEDSIHLTDIRATRRIRKHGLKGDEWKSPESPNHIAMIVHGIKAESEGRDGE